jgi:regulator of nonsense transcripts 2
VLNTALLAVLAPPNRAALAALATEQREKEDSARVSRQRPVLRLCAELALVGLIKDGPNRSGAETIMRTLKDLVCGFPSPK